jgi:hypothetical protein
MLLTTAIKVGPIRYTMDVQHEDPNEDRPYIVKDAWLEEPASQTLKEWFPYIYIFQPSTLHNSTQ